MAFSIGTSDHSATKENIPACVMEGLKNPIAMINIPMYGKNFLTPVLENKALLLGVEVDLWLCGFNV